jgi:hypothetical protein
MSHRLVHVGADSFVNRGLTGKHRNGDGVGLLIALVFTSCRVVYTRSLIRSTGERDR